MFDKPQLLTAGVYLLSFPKFLLTLLDLRPPVLGRKPSSRYLFVIEYITENFYYHENDNYFVY